MAFFSTEVSDDQYISSKRRTQLRAGTPPQSSLSKTAGSSAKLFDMVARCQFPKPFALIPGGRAVGWLESDVDQWVLERKATLTQEAE